MRSLRSILYVGFVASATIANAQIISPSRIAIAPAPVDSTVIKLTQRVEALEAMVAQLQQKVVFVKSVAPLVLDAGGDMTIRGGQISVDATGALSLRAGTVLGVAAGSDLNLRSYSNTSLRSGNLLSVEASGVLDLKGSTVRHNGGGVPIACAPSGTVVPCNPSVGVPPPPSP